uniref:Vacuolar protein sorting-associated protein n=1 Tax=Encephalitozoon cuniculi TaxID=6035 RepID=M1KIZ8_ENCCN|nr:vacuolar protein sorting-associated protein [Encephalitozoon cuniculi]
MLKRILLKTLNRFLGNYVENIDKHQLELGIFKGYVSVSNLRIKSSVISRLFDGRVVSNRIGTLRVLAPWKSLARKPVEIYIRDVDIKIGKAGFCWCFLGESPCMECIEYEKYEFMSKLDKLSFLSDAREGGSAFFEDLIMGDGFRVLVEDVNVEYVSGTSIALRVQRLEFNGKGGSVRNAKNLDITGVEMAVASKIMGPLNICSIVKMSPRDMKPRIEVHLDDFRLEMRQQMIEEILVGFKEYSEDRVRWTLFRSHPEYRKVLEMAREMNLWEDQKDPASVERADVVEVWKHLIQLQKKIGDSKGVALEEIAGIMSRASEYRKVLGRPSLRPDEVEKKKRCEREICLERLLKIKRSCVFDSEKKSWKSFLLFMKERASKKKTSTVVPMVFNVKRAALTVIDEKHQGFRIVLPEGRVSARDLLSPARLDFKGNEWKMYFVDTRLNEHEPYNELISFLLDVRGTFAYDGPGIHVKGLAGEWRVLNYRRELPRCFEGLMRIAGKSWVPSYGSLACRGKVRADFKADMVSMESDLERFADIRPSGRYGVESSGVVLSYVNDGISMKKAASLTIASSFVYWINPTSEKSEALSNRIETAILLVDGVFYVKTSMVDLYAHGVHPSDFGGGGTVFPAGFVVPNFEVCSDAIRINGPNGRAELRRIKMSGNGGTIFDVEIFRGKVLDRNGRVVCRVPKMKMEARIGKALFLDIEYLKVCGVARRIAKLAREMSWMAQGRGSTQATLKVGRVEAILKRKGSILSISVDEYFQGLARSVKAILNKSMVDIKDLEVGEEYACRSAMVKVHKEDIRGLDVFTRIFGGAGGDSGTFKVSVGVLLIRPRNGLEIEARNIRAFMNGADITVHPLEIGISGADGSHSPLSGKKREVRVCISKFEKSGIETVVEGSIGGEIDEEMIVGIRDEMMGIPVSSNTPTKTNISFDISLYVMASGKSVRMECPLVFRKTVDGWNAVVRRVSVTLGNGEHTVLSGINAKATEDVLGLFIDRIEICLAPSILALMFYPLLCSEGDARYTKRMKVGIDEILVSIKDLDEMRIRDVKYDDELSLDLSILSGAGSKVTYRKVSSRKDEYFLLSVAGGCYEMNSLASVTRFCSSEYVQICEKLGIQISKEQFHVLLMDLVVQARSGLSFLRINLPVGHFDVQELHSLKGRLLCSLDIYDPSAMKVVPVVEENVFVVKKYGTLLDVRALARLRILYLQGITDMVAGFFGPRKTESTVPVDPFHCKVRIKNATDTALQIKTQGQFGSIGGGEAGEFNINYEEHGICVGKGETSTVINIVDSSITSFRAEEKNLIADVLYDGRTRLLTITHNLSFFNLCEIDLMGRMHCPNVSASEMQIPRHSSHTIPQASTFFLEIGVDGKYSGVGRIDANAIEKGAVSSFGTVCKLSGITIGVDVVVRDAGAMASVAIIFYPTFEVVNRTTSVLNLVLSIDKEAVHMNSKGVLRKNIPFSIGRNCKEDVYDIDSSEIPLLLVHNLNNQAGTKVFQSRASIQICPGHSGEIRKEQCEIQLFFGRHVLMHKVRMAICPPMMIVNHLSDDIWINGIKFCRGSSCSDRLKIIHSLCVGEYGADGSVVIRKKSVRVVTLVRKNYRGHRARVTHEGMVWTNEAIFGGLGPRAGAYPDYIRFLLEFKGDSSTRIVEFRYTHFIRNQTRMRLLAVSEQVCYYVEAGEEVPFNTSTNGFYLFIADCLDIRSLRSCGVFIPLDIKTTKYFRLQGSEAVLLSVSRSVDSEQHVFGIRMESDWPYMIYNDTDTNMKFTQGHDTVEHDVKRESVYRYALDSLVFDPVILLRVGDRSIQVDLNRDGSMVTSGIVVSASQGEIARILRISRGTIPESESRAYLNIVVDDLAVSLVDKGGDEILCGHLRGLEVTIERISRAMRAQREKLVTEYAEWIISTVIESVQVDNQNVFCVFPVIFHPLDKDLRIGAKRRGSRKFLVFELAVGDSTHHVSVSNVYCRVQDFALNIEESLAKKVSKMFEVKEHAPRGHGRNIRIQNLKMERLRAKVNFLKDVESDFISSVTGFLINNISDFSLEMDGMKESCLYTTTEELRSLLASFYLSQFRRNLYKVLTHFDLIGNIGSFTESVSVGIKDLFVEPTLSRTNVARGIAKGGKSFLKNTIYGVSNTVGKFSKSIGTGARLVGCNIELRHAKGHHSYACDVHLLVPRSKHSKGSVVSILRGTGDLFDSITRGIAGIATSPIEGASQGVTGVVKGLGKGILGAFTRPIVEVADLVTGISDTIKVSMDGRIKRLQYPRPRGFVGWYDEGLSQGFYIFMFIVKKVNEEERFVDGTFGNFNGKCHLILTTKRLLVSDTISILDVQLRSIVVEESNHKLMVGELCMSVEKPSFVASVKSVVEGAPA